MSLNETMRYLDTLVTAVSRDLTKVHRGNKTAAQRIRVSTIQLEKIGKRFRKESIAAERYGRLKRKKKR